jgi:DNA (cytosine-5)-methyltransferase 1
MTQNPLFTEIETDTFGRLLSNLGVAVNSGWPDRFGAELKSLVLSNAGIRPKTLSLFSGAGGLDIGFHDAGFDIVSMIEIEQKFVESLKANAAEGGYLHGAEPVCIDIRDYVPDLRLSVDFIIGGPPCQTFSAAGRRAAGVKGTTDKRGTLFEEYVRLLELLRPRGFLFENVYGITGAENGDAWLEITGAFASAGYQIEFRVLDAADFGVPQHRERMFIVGVEGKKFNFPRPTHGPDSPSAAPFYSAGLAVSNVPLSEDERKVGLGGRYGHLLTDIPPGLNYSFFTEELGHPNPIFAWRSKFSDFLYKADPSRPVRTIKAQGGQYTGPFHWDSRPFSVGEMKRLQTFPDEYKIIGNRQVAVHQIGNSVPPQIARVLAIAIRQQLFEDTLIEPLPILVPCAQLGFRRRKRELNSVYKKAAEKALVKSQNSLTKRTLPKSTTYFASLESGFTLNNRTKEFAEFKIRQLALKSEWRIHIEGIGAGIETLRSSDSPFSIVIEPSVSNPWVIGVDRIVLSGDALTEASFTTVWKALDRLVSSANIKADLVQLCGYYQYSPRFFSELSIAADNVDWRWVGLRSIGRGTATREIIRSHDIAGLLHMSPRQFTEFAGWLRSLGFEVRNHKTNSQIPAGSFLIPYSFPTLTASSVQLRKTLI